MKEHTIDATISSVATKAAYGGSAAAIVGAGTSSILGFSVSDFAMLGGLVVGVVTALVNWYYRFKEGKRKEQVNKHVIAESEARRAEAEQRTLESKRREQTYIDLGLDPDEFTVQKKQTKHSMFTSDLNRPSTFDQRGHTD